MSTSRYLVTAVVLLGAGIGIGIGIGWWLNRPATLTDTVLRPDTPGGNVLYWYDPMRPDVHFDKPGRSPFMDMELVAKYGVTADQGAIAINPRVTQNLGVRTVVAEQSTVAPLVRVTGTIAVDERRMAVVTTRASGWLERLDVRAVGDTVRHGQRLGAFYSPDLLAAQEEFLLARRAGDPLLLPAVRRRLDLLGMSVGQLERMSRRGIADRQVDILAPISGVVAELLVRQGSALSAGMPVMNLVDLSRVWVLAEVPEAQSTWLKAGQAVEVVLAAAGAPPVPGVIDHLYPELSAATRTTRVRIVVPNEKLALRPGMSATVIIHGASRPALLVPTEALIRSGERTAVILAEGEGRFRPVAVLAGAEQGDRTEIRSGLKAGNQVVASGQFLIDSEASLRGALDRLLPGAAQ
ncbi:MAG: efflux RND transporter periplasmic adaptor subunit [Gammaproteobacteria bacterium]